MEITLGLHAIVAIIGGAITLAIAGMVVYLNDDLHDGFGATFVGGIFTILASVPGVRMYESYVETVAIQKQVAEEMAELKAEGEKIYETLPTEWRQLLDFLNSKENHRAKNLVLERFLKGTVPTLNLDQFGYLSNNVECDNLLDFEARCKCRNKFADMISPFVEFDIVAALNTDEPETCEMPENPKMESEAVVVSND